MLASSGTQATIAFFLRVHRARNPLTIPRNIMTDFDRAQINAILQEYFHALLRIFLCWWHVLHAWQKHFHTTKHPELWELLKRWIRMTDLTEFNATWIKIKEMAPPAFVVYLTTYWMPENILKMWSAMYRKDRTIFAMCDTNMLIEAWHHVLKGKFFRGKRNRRLDHLLSTLLNDVLPYYALKQRRQELGFEGVDIEVKKRCDVMERSKVYVKDDIEHIEDGKYLVKSKSTPTRIYEVDLETYTCTCLDFPLISFCKHLCAVQSFFAEPTGPGLSDVPIPDIPSFADTPAPQTDCDVLAPKPDTASRTAVLLAEKLERLAARLRQSKGSFPSFEELEAVVDSMMENSDDGGAMILPVSQRLPPNLKTWHHTHAAMMPGIKRRRKRVGDAYGGGANSGNLAKKSKTVSYVCTPSLISRIAQTSHVQFYSRTGTGGPFAPFSVAVFSCHPTDTIYLYSPNTLYSCLLPYGSRYYTLYPARHELVILLSPAIGHTYYIEVNSHLYYLVL
ncbi:hypothetical protein B0H15DRAFT_905686 [Mycena belliarum]|uniref:SWIM-type domain-containing protein n=1 Tax=Mycena belliarum TaxID=1033014 RepID=A0AAD6XQM9_9AGAR|nr:hypothetical protein B0H15DRAFT_905686 [Mycena belliae]